MNWFSIILNIIGNILIFICSGIFLNKISILEFISLIYLAPILLNLIFSLLQMNNKNGKGYMSYIYPLISFISYIQLGLNLNEHNANWINFVNRNSTTLTGGTHIIISAHLNNFSNLCFAFILYFGIQFIVCLVIKKIKKNRDVRN